MLRLLLVCTLFTALAAVEEMPVPAVQTAPLDGGHRELAAALAIAVEGEAVDYAALRRDRAALDRYLAQLAAATVPEGRSGRLAFWINAYNATTLALVLHLLPPGDDPAAWADFSVMAVDGFWTNYRFMVAGEAITIDAIEHQRLRPLGDPRIHFAINCASESCPPLMTEPFTAAEIDAQLDAVSRAFVASDDQVRIDRPAGLVRLNPLLDWFKEDFGGHDGVRSFLVGHAGADRAQALERLELTWFDYDWSLNQAARP